MRGGEQQQQAARDGQERCSWPAFGARDRDVREVGPGKSSRSDARSFAPTAASPGRRLDEDADCDDGKPIHDDREWGRVIFPLASASQ